MRIQAKVRLFSSLAVAVVALVLLTSGVVVWRSLILADRLDNVEGTINELRRIDELASEAVALPSDRVLTQWVLQFDRVSRAIGSSFADLNFPEGRLSEVQGRLNAIDRAVRRLNDPSFEAGSRAKAALTARVAANRTALYRLIEGLRDELREEREDAIQTIAIILLSGVILLGGGLVLVSLSFGRTVRSALVDIGNAIGSLRPSNRNHPIAAGRKDEIGQFIEELETLRRELVDAFHAEEQGRRRAEEFSRAKSWFVTTTSHELRTPLNGLLGSLTLLSQTQLTARQDRYLGMARTSGQALLELINDVLDFSKVESGELTFENAPFSPLAVIDEVYSTFAASAQNEALDLRIEKQVPDSLVLVGDRNRIRQVLSNLVGNAVKFTRSGEVCIDATARSLSDTRSCELTISVSDTGPGIPADRIEAIFEAFQQADETVARVHGGTGLGLALSRRLTEEMGGALTVESEAGRGSRFSVRVTLPTSTEGPAVAQALEPRRDDSGVLVGMQILLVDDVAINRVIAGEVLQARGCSVLCAENGREALELAMSQRFDAILMDVQMPEMDGVEATQRLREQGLETPVVGLTANAFEGQRESYLAAGMNVVISKPVDWDQLTSVLSAVVERSISAPEVEEVQARPSSEAINIDQNALNALSALMPADRLRVVAREALAQVEHAIEALSAKKTPNDAAEVAHSMKGMCRNLGFALLGDLFERIELNPEMQPSAETLASLRTAKRDAQQEFERFVAR